MNIIYKIAVVFLLPITLLLTTLQIFSLNTNYFAEKYTEYNISESTGIRDDDLRDITDKLLGYLKDDTDNLNIEKVIDGEKQQVFGEREVQHMVDVKELFLTGNKIRNISVVVVSLSLLALLVNDRKSVGKTLILSSLISFVLIFILFLMMNADFSKYFTYFHEIFFDNDLWLLDPNTDVLIQMLPIEFFYSIATKVSIWFIIELVAVLGLGIFLNKLFKTMKFDEQDSINRV